MIRDAMGGVPKEGSSRASFVGAAFASGGKTGTAQAIGLKAGEKYSQIKADERKRDHSLYVAFAPVEAPQVALAVIVENAGFGSTSAAPIARRVFDYLLTGAYPSEEDIALIFLAPQDEGCGTYLPRGTPSVTPASPAPAS